MTYWSWLLARRANFFEHRWEWSSTPIRALSGCCAIALLFQWPPRAVLELADRDSSLARPGYAHFVDRGRRGDGQWRWRARLGDALQSLPGEARLLATSPRPKLCWLMPGSAFCSRGFPSHQAQAYAARNLEQRGVRNATNASHSPSILDLWSSPTGSWIDTRTVIWAGGLKASSLSGSFRIHDGATGAYRRRA